MIEKKSKVKQVGRIVALSMLPVMLLQSTSIAHDLTLEVYDYKNRAYVNDGKVILRNTDTNEMKEAIIVNGKVNFKELQNGMYEYHLDGHEAEKGRTSYNLQNSKINCICNIE